MIRRRSQTQIAARTARLALALALFATSSLLAPNTSAQSPPSPSQIETLTVRPRMVDIIPAYEGNATANSFLSTSTLTALVENLPAFIAGMEIAYPDLIYVFLGRDAVFLGDAVDAYYLSRGEAGRVIRLDASRFTLNESEVKLFEFLRENGFQPTANGLERPYIMFDRTEYETAETYHNTSQMKRLLSAGFRGAQALGIKPEQLKRKFAGVRLNGSHFQFEPQPLTKQSIKRHFSSWRMLRTTVNHPYTVLDVPAETLSAHVEGLIDRSEWHGSFGAMSTDIAGRIVTSPTEKPLVDRQALAFELKSVWDHVSASRFHKLVHDEMNKISPARAQEFEKERKAPVAIASLLHNQGLDLTIEDRITRLKILEESKAQTSELERYRQITELIQDEGLKAIVADFTRQLKTGTRAEAAPTVGAFLARYDLLLQMKQDKTTDPLQYERLIARSLLDLQRITTWMARSSPHLQFITDRTLTSLQGAMEKATSPVRADVMADFGRVGQTLFPDSDRYIQQIAKVGGWKHFAQGAAEFWRKFFKDPIARLQMGLSGALSAGAIGGSMWFGDSSLFVLFIPAAIVQKQFLQEWMRHLRLNRVEPGSAQLYTATTRAWFKDLNNNETQAQAHVRDILPEPKQNSRNALRCVFSLVPKRSKTN